VRTAGSPPRAWGKGQPGVPHSTARRFTPTGVGKRPYPGASSVSHPVHPHGRGEKGDFGYAYRDIIGSPPRAWGKGGGPIPCGCSTRFTPTGVGKSLVRARLSYREPVHPHGRGEKASGVSPPTTVDGSPPRAWGKGRHATYRVVKVRFTPTGVGKSTWMPSASALMMVHPHGRGEKVL